MEYEIKEIGQIAKIITGNTPSKKVESYYHPPNIAFIKPSDLNNCGITNLAYGDEWLSEQGSKVARVVDSGAVLVTCIGTIGKVGVALRDISFNQQINAIIPNEDIAMSRYIAYAILFRKNLLIEMANAPVVPIINKSTFSKFKIPLPPLQTQQKIVEVLDKAQTLIDQRKEQIELMDDLIQSTFYEMFGDPVVNEKGWPNGKINDLTVRTQYGTSKKASEEKGQFPILRMNNITYKGDWDFSSMKYVDLDEKEQSKYLVQKGELLFNRTNSKELVGKTAVYREENSIAYAGYLIKLIVKPNANSEYISAYLNSKHGKMVLLNMAKNIVGMANINAEELKKINILIPPIDLQNQFADIVQQIVAQKQLMLESLIEMENNYSSLMQRAFKGELV